MSFNLQQRANIHSSSKKTAVQGAKVLIIVTTLQAKPSQSKQNTFFVPFVYKKKGRTKNKTHCFYGRRDTYQQQQRWDGTLEVKNKKLHIGKEQKEQGCYIGCESSCFVIVVSVFF